MEEKKMIRYHKKNLSARLDELVNISDIMGLDINDYEKACKICEFYNGPEGFMKAYELVLRVGTIKPELSESVEEIERIYKKLSEYEDGGIFSIVNHALEFEEFFHNYEYARFVVENYITSSKSPYYKLFLDELGIDDDVFEYCVKTVEELDVDLFKKYQEKKENAFLIKYDDNIEAFKNIANGIKTGYLFDGTAFDILEFWKLVPLKYFIGRSYDLAAFSDINKDMVFGTQKFQSIVEVFTKATIPDDSDVIVSYMRENRIRNFTYLTNDEYKTMYTGVTIRKNVSVINDGVLENVEKDFFFSIDDADDVIVYARANNLPPILEVYKIIQERYMTGEITHEICDECRNTLENNVYQKTLIPSCK